jgi:hypothetical protein
MHIQIVLKQKRQSNLTAICNAEQYISSITGNPLFSSAEIVAQLAKVVTALNSIHTEITSANAGKKAAKISAARDTLNREVKYLKDLVQGVANKPETPDAERLTIVESAGMSDRAHATRSAGIFRAIQGTVSGTIILLARGGAKANEWQYTTDIKSFTGRIALETTTRAMLEVPNLPVNTTIACFHKPIIAGVKADWEGPVIIMVL